MPLLSCFTPCGHWVLGTSRPSHGELIYNQIIKGWNGNYSSAVGSRSEAWAYATAMLLARVRYAKERAANQLTPTTVVEMLPVREKQYGLVPGRLDTIQQRQAALAQAYLLPLGARFTAVTQALSSVLGSDFLAYRVTKQSEIVTFPASPGNGPGNWSNFRIAAKIVRLTSNVPATGTPFSVSYVPIDANSRSAIAVGDNVVVSANNISIAERVAVTAAGAQSFTAMFTKSHDAGDVATTGYFPYWVSTQGHVLVILKSAAARDPEKVRKANVILRQIMRGWITWDVVGSVDGAHVQQWTIDDPVLGLIDSGNTVDSAAFP